jgi:hypothetical protein
MLQMSFFVNGNVLELPKFRTSMAKLKHPQHGAYLGLVYGIFEITNFGIIPCFQEVRTNLRTIS